MKPWHGVALGVLAFAGFVGALLWQTRRANEAAWTQYQAAAAARGDRLEFDAHVPPPVPDAENFAATPCLAQWFDYTLDPVSRRQVWRAGNLELQRSALNALVSPTRRLEVTAFSLTNAVRTSLPALARQLTGRTNDPAPSPCDAAALILAHLAPADATRNELAAALPRSHVRFATHYDERPLAGMKMSHFSLIRTLSKLGQTRAVAELGVGDPAAATDDIRSILRLAEGASIEPTLIAQLVAASTLRQALPPLVQGVADHYFTAEQLSALQRDLMQLDFLSGNVLAWRGERAFGLEMVDELARDSFKRELFLDTSLETHVQEAAFTAWSQPAFAPLVGFWDTVRLTHCREYERTVFPLVDSTRRVWRATEITRARDSFETAPRKARTFLIRDSLPRILNTSRHLAEAQAFTDLARTACALERHRLAHGTLPATLADLAPVLEGPLPHDVTTGAPLVYRVGSDGHYTLYQSGWDQADNGGDPLLDWVWPSRLRDPEPVESLRRRKVMSP